MCQIRRVLIQFSVTAALFGSSIFVALALFELLMQKSREGTVAMRVTPSAYGVYDESLGVRYEPGTSISYAYLDSAGRVLECLPDISRTNADGFRGLDTLRDYGSAGQRVLVSGDSFSHWNNDGMTIVDYTKARLNESGFDVSLINVAGGTFGLEHMVVHLADAIEQTAPLRPDLVAIQFIRDDITRDWWYLDTRQDEKGRDRARISRSAACLEPGSDCGSDEYLIEARATQAWCESLKGTDEVDVVADQLVETYDDIRGFFVFVRRAFARLGLIDRQALSVIPRVVSIDQSNTARIESAIEVIRSSGARFEFVYLPTAGEIEARQVYAFNETETAVLRYYEEHLGVSVIYPADYSAFDGVPEFAISPFDGHPSVELQKAYGRYLAELFGETLD